MVGYAELLRENKRMLDRSIREIERERQGLQTQEKKVIAEIKKSAKQGQMVIRVFRSLIRIFFLKTLTRNLQANIPFFSVHPI